MTDATEKTEDAAAAPETPDADAALAADGAGDAAGAAPEGEDPEAAGGDGAEAAPAEEEKIRFGFIVRPWRKLKAKLARLKRLLLPGLMATAFFGGGYFIILGVMDFYDTTRNARVLGIVEKIEGGELTQATTMLIREYEDGWKPALDWLAWLSMRQGKYPQALFYSRTATSASEDDKYPLEILGNLALMGRGHINGVNAALSFFKSAAKEAIEGPEVAYTEMLERALRITPDRGSFTRILREAQTQESSIAIMYLGNLTFLGDGVRQSYPESIALWTHALEMGQHDEARTSMAGASWFGISVKRDQKKAELLYRASAAHGEPLAEFSLGLIHLRRNGGNGDTSAVAERWFRSSARHGYGAACAALGLMVMNRHEGMGIGLSAAAQWFNEGYKLGDETSSLFLALMLSSGIGIEKDEDRGMTVLRDLVDRTHSVAARKLIMALVWLKNPQDVFEALWKVSRDVLYGLEPSGSPSKSAPIGAASRAFCIYSNDSSETVSLIQKGAAFRNTVSVYKNIISLEGVGTITVAIDPATAARSFNDLDTKNQIPKVPPPMSPEGYVSEGDTDSIKIPEELL